ncbi:MAG: hypothetical protein MJ231_07415, partial [bacterium]|nr:hypothetical protein [bacterium]
MKVINVCSNSIGNYSVAKVLHNETKLAVVTNNFSKDNVYNVNLNHSYFTDMKIAHRPKTINFMGKVVHIVDGGNHATNMQHFAKAVSKNSDIIMHDVEVNSANKNTKQLKSLENQLKYLNNRSSLMGEYVAIPALASVPLLNIKDQYNRVMGENKTFTPQNIKANKEKILSFLKKLYDYPSLYREYINYMDSSKQGIEYTYGVIQEINKLIDKGAKVYVPSGHPQEETLKWMAGEKGLKPELYHYIATGKDTNYTISDMHAQIKRNNWYSFNLLSLSNANIVGVKGAQGAQDYMFAAYDSCVTDGARGVYNFTPIRKNGILVGYSYTDKTTNEYPYNEFPANGEVANLVKFVGKHYTSVLATQSETAKLKECIRYNRNTNYCSDKLYSIDEVYSQDEIRRERLYLQGRYVDRTLKTFFGRGRRYLLSFIL